MKLSNVTAKTITIVSRAGTNGYQLLINLFVNYFTAFISIFNLRTELADQDPLPDTVGIIHAI